MDITLPNKPRLHPSYYIIAVPDSNEIQLQGEGRTFRLAPSAMPDSSRLLNELIATLDGTHTIDEIVQTMGEFDKSQVLDALYRLYEARLLDDANPSGTPLSADQRQFYASQLTFFSHFTNEAYAAHDTLARSNVTVLGLGPLGSCTLESLADNGVGELVGIAVATDVPADVYNRIGQQRSTRYPQSEYRGVTLAERDVTSIAEAVRGTHLLIAALDRADPDLLDKVNEACLQTDTLWLLAGLRAWEGLHRSNHHPPADSMLQML